MLILPSGMFSRSEEWITDSQNPRLGCWGSESLSVARMKIWVERIEQMSAAQQHRTVTISSAWAN